MIPDTQTQLLGTSISVLSGFPFPSTQFTERDGKPLIRIRDLQRGNTETNFAGAFSPEYLIRTGDILIGMDGDFNVVRWRGPEALLNQRVCRVTTTGKGVDSSFLFWWLQPHIRDIHRQTPQTTVRHLSVGAIYDIPMPPMDEAKQRLAAAILDHVDAAIKKTSAVVDKLKVVRAGVLQDLLTRGVDVHGELGDPSVHPEAFHESPAGVVPKAWEVAPFGKYVVDWAVGPRFSGDLYATDGNVATLRTTDMDDDGSLSLDAMPLARLDLSFCGSHLLQRGDLIVSRSGTCGIAAVFNEFRLPVLPGAFLLRFRFSNRVNPEFMRLYLNSPAGRMRVTRIAEGGVQKNIRGTSLLPLQIVLPDRPTQDRIVSRMRMHDAAVRAEESVTSKLTCLKAALMADLLAGLALRDSKGRVPVESR